MSLSITDQVAAIRAAIDQFMVQLDRDPADEQLGLRSLAIALDRLVAAYFQTEDIEPTDNPEPEIPRAVEFHRRSAQAFPELGLYPYADPGGESGEETALVADAIDDLGDIASDLFEVLWHLDNAPARDGIWEFRFGYQSHWGHHLHSLRHYLHSSRVAAW